MVRASLWAMKPPPRARRRTSRNAKGHRGGGSSAHQARPRQARVYAPSTLQLRGETCLHCRRVKKLWEVFYEADTDVVFSGHEHNYERFSPQDPQGKVDPERGIRQFVV